MTQHSQNGEGVEVIQSDQEAAAEWSFIECKHCSQYEGDFTADLAASFAAYRQSLTAREPATADVGREELRCRLQDVLQAEFGDTYDCTRVWSAWGYGTMDEHDFVPVLDRMDQIIDGFVEALSRAAPLSGHAMAEGEGAAGRLAGLQEAALIAQTYGVPGGHIASTARGVAEAIRRRIATTPPTTNDAMPADPADIALDAYNQGYRDGCEDSDSEPDMELARDGWHDWLHDCAALKLDDATPKPSPTPKGGPSKEWCLNMARLEEGQEIGAGMPDHPLRFPETTPKGGLPGRGEVDADVVARMSVMSLGLVAYITGLSEDLRWTPEFTRYVSNRADEITALRRTIGQPLAPAEAIRDGGEGGAHTPVRK